MVHFCRAVIKKNYLLFECKKWSHSSQEEPFCGFCLFNRDMTMFSYTFELNNSSEIPKIFHNFILFYRIISYWNDVNKKVVDEYFEVLDLNKHYVCKHFWKFPSISSPILCWLPSWANFSFFFLEKYLIEKAISYFHMST